VAPFRLPAGWSTPSAAATSARTPSSSWRRSSSSHPTCADRQFWTRPAFFEALGSQIASMPDSSREVLDASSTGYGDLPLVTISRADADDHTLRRQDALAALSTRGRHVRATRGGHWVPLDDPGAVIDAVRLVHEEAAAG
jgi:hypothetical protein